MALLGVIKKGHSFTVSSFSLAGQAISPQRSPFSSDEASFDQFSYMKILEARAD
jgi:hypothetical protein